MNNLKSNNRFSFLDEEQKNTEPNKNPPREREREYEYEYEYDNKPKYPVYNQFKNYNSTPAPPVKKDFEIKEDEFPDLSNPVKTNSNNIKSKSFASLLEKKEVIEEINKEEKIIVPPGWSYYKYTKFKNGICGDNCSKVTIQIQKPFIEKKYEIKKPTHKIELNETEEIIEALSLLHEKRTKEYKELWGEDEWERMFVCPNYDYEYFDKLDEAYEIEQYNLNDQYYNEYDDEDYY
jgi:hypothetical protein